MVREVIIHVVKLGTVTYRLLDMLEEHLQLGRPYDGVWPNASVGESEGLRLTRKDVFCQMARLGGYGYMHTPGGKLDV